VREFLGIVDIQTDRLIHLVEDLLVVTRIEAGKLSFDVEGVRAAELVEEVVQGLDEHADRVQTDIRLDRFVADAHRVEQVLTNLLKNALKFSMPPEPVLLSASSDGGQAVFRVSDRGIGIAAEDLDRIFERFHQTDAATTRRAEGAGLGLYITKKLVDAMGGRIEVVSVPGAGSTFTVRLPMARPTAPSRPSATARAG
jgi:signal transduction histidine kinase